MVELGRVVGEAVGIGAAAIPDGQHDAVAAGSALADTIDEHLACCRAPGIRRVTAIRRVVRAVDVLDSGDVVHHERLGIAPGLVGITRAGRSARIGAVAHHGIFHAVVIERHVALMGMLEPQGVSDLMHDSEIGIVALRRACVHATGIVDPDVAAGRICGWEISPRGAGQVRLRKTQIGRRCARSAHFLECQIADRRVEIQCRTGNGLLRTIERAKSLRRLTVSIG